MSCPSSPIADTDPAHRRRTAIGIALGLTASLSWAFYNVSVQIGRVDGFSSADLTILRYGGGALFLLPLLIARRHRLADHLSLFRVVVLTIAIGPPFAFLINSGYGLAPLAHGIVIGPGAAMLSTNILAVLFGRHTMSLHRQVGMLILVLGLAATATDQPAGSDGGPAWLGDLCFVGSGSLWGVFTYLLGRWSLDPVDTTAAVALASAICFLPIYWLAFTPAALPTGAWIEQLLYQGLLGGSFAIVVFAAAVSVLGPGLAALFPALVPPLAALVSIPLIGTWPNTTQWVGVVLATLGLLVSLDTSRWLLKAFRR